MQINSLDSTVIISNNLEQMWQQAIKQCASNKLFITVDENTKKHCLPLIRYIKELKKAHIIETTSGEKNKNIASANVIWQQLSDNKADRQSLLINLGGGLLCDLGGFAASTFKRGIRFINIPTTLLACVDASIGGKLAINFNALKNEIGLFRSPDFVLIYTDFIKTLDYENILSGYSEMIKHSLIYSSSNWKTIQQLDVKNIDYKLLNTLITKSIFIKNEFVKSDPREKNIRKALNFGHTIGHAIESYLIDKETPVSHGKAVAYGMLCESYLSYKKMGLQRSDLDQIAKFITAIYGAITIPDNQYDYLYELMTHDKKNEDTKILFTLISAIGTVEINKLCPQEDVYASLDYLGSLSS